MKREFNEDHTPLAYLITFRCYGTWLHGNDKGSIDRHHNRYGAPLIPPDLRWHRQNLRSLKEERREPIVRGQMVVASATYGPKISSRERSTMSN